MIGIGTDFANLSGERSYSLSYYTKGALIHPNGRVRSAEGLSAQRESSSLPRLTDIGGFAATRGCTPCAASRLSLHTHKNSTPAVGVCTIFAGFIILSGR